MRNKELTLQNVILKNDDLNKKGEYFLCSVNIN